MNRGREPDPEYEFYIKYDFSLRKAIGFLLTEALYLTKNRHDADDLVCSLLEKLITSPAPTEPVRHWKSFLKTALVNLYIDMFIRTKWPIPLEDIPEDSTRTGPGPEEQAISEDIRRNFWQKVSTLSAIHQEVVRLRFCYFTFSIQRTHSEIATELGIPVGTVASRLHDALKILRRWLSGGMEGGQGHEH